MKEGTLSKLGRNKALVSEADLSPDLVEAQRICVVEEGGQSEVSFDDDRLVFNATHWGTVASTVAQHLNQLTREGFNIKGTIRTAAT